MAFRFVLSSLSSLDRPLTASPPSGSPSRGNLRLKGRIYVRHIKRIIPNTAGEMSLTIEMEDERLDSFILVFKDRASLDAWKNQIHALFMSFHPSQTNSPDRALDIEEFGGSAKAARVLSGSTASTASAADSLHGFTRSTRSSSTSHGSHKAVPSRQQPFGDDPAVIYDVPTPTPHHVSSGPSNSLAPLPHAPLDLMLIVSLPPPKAPRSTASLKLRVIKTSLDFILASLGIKDRLSLVTFEVGTGGRVRRTPYLCLGRQHSRARLQKFVDEIGCLDELSVEDEFLLRASKDEKTDVVTAVNHGV